MLKEATKTFRCDLCDRTFQTPQALSSHVTYNHRKAKPLQGTATSLPPEISRDPRILALRKKLEIKRLENEIEDESERPKTVDLAERVTRLEENLKEVEKLKAYQQTQDKTLKNLSDSLNLLKEDNEDLKRITLRSIIYLAIASDNQDLVTMFINMWKRIANPAIIHEIEQEIIRALSRE